MTDLPTVVSLLLRGVIVVFTCLAIGVCAARARAHLAWLVPTALGQALSVIGGLLNMAWLASLRSHGLSDNPLRWLLVPTQFLYMLGTACLVWAAVAAFLTMRSLAAGTQPNPPPVGAPGQWPPPPSAPSE